MSQWRELMLTNPPLEGKVLRLGFAFIFHRALLGSTGLGCIVLGINYLLPRRVQHVFIKLS